MSYILDALKKAEAERELGAVPHLHAQGAIDPPGADAARHARRVGLGVAAGLGLALVLAGLWWALRPAPASPAAVQPAAPPVVAATAPAPPAPPAAAPDPMPVPMPVPMTVPMTFPMPVAAPFPMPGPTPVPVAAPAPVPLPADVRRQQPVPVKGTVQALESLPPETRRELPALAVGGAIYSPQASARVLIVNGQLLHEGDAVAPGLVLVSIGPKSAQMRWRDVRFSVGY